MRARSVEDRARRHRWTLTYVAFVVTVEAILVIGDKVGWF